MAAGREFFRQIVGEYDQPKVTRRLPELAQGFQTVGASAATISSCYEVAKRLDLYLSIVQLDLKILMRVHSSQYKDMRLIGVKLERCGCEFAA